MEKKKSFLLYADLADTVHKLSDEDAGKLLKMIFSHANGEDIETDNLLLDIVFSPIKAQMDRDAEKWLKTREARSEAGKKGGRPPKQKKAKALFCLPDKAKEKQNLTKKAVNVNVNGNVNGNVKDNTLVDLAEPKSTDGEILEVEVLRPQEKAGVPCPYTCIVESFNATCRCLQGCRIATPTRKQALRRAWAFFEYDMVAINKFFETVNESDFLCGRRKGSNWKCSFDWIFKMNNIVKIIEGNYTNK